MRTLAGKSFWVKLLWKPTSNRAQGSQEPGGFHSLEECKCPSWSCQCPDPLQGAGGSHTPSHRDGLGLFTQPPAAIVTPRGPAEQGNNAWGLGQGSWEGPRIGQGSREGPRSYHRPRKARQTKTTLSFMDDSHSPAKRSSQSSRQKHYLEHHLRNCTNLNSQRNASFCVVRIF